MPHDALQCPSCDFVSDEVGNEKTFMRDLLVGAQVGEYHFRERIGSGGMSFVYEGFHEAIGKRVAIKVLRPDFTDDPDSMRRLQAEAKAVNAIRHRGIIDMFNVGTLVDGRPYVVMEFLEGQTLEELLLAESKLPALELMTWLEQVTAALGAAHHAGVIHRDIKPSNIFIVKESDGSSYVKLLDFGLAKHSKVETNEGRRITQMVGTPDYMAPEQIDGDFSPRSDLYSLGVVAYRALTGRLPFEFDSVMELALAHQKQQPRPPSDHDSQIPAVVDELVLSLLEKSPAKRPSSAETVRAALSRIRRELQQSDTYRWRMQAAGQSGFEDEERGPKEETLPELDSHPELKDAVALIREQMGRTELDFQAAQAVTPLDHGMSRTPLAVPNPWQEELDQLAAQAVTPREVPLARTPHALPAWAEDSERSPSARTEPNGLEARPTEWDPQRGPEERHTTETWEPTRPISLPPWGWGVLAGSVVVLFAALWLLR